LDAGNVEAEVVALARQMTTADPAIRAVLLECANLPPYAAAVQRAVGLPVYDVVTMIHHVQSALSRAPFRTGAISQGS
jgi:Asp/Glu/hydantoin racemase